MSTLDDLPHASPCAPAGASTDCPIHSICNFSFACSRDTREEHPYAAQRKSYQRKTLFWLFDTDDDNLIVVVSGAMMVFRYTEDGRPTIYSLIGRGLSLGEVRVFTRQRPLFFGRALTDMEICYVHGGYLRQAVAANPELFSNFSLAISNGYGATTTYVDMIGITSVHDRVKRALGLLAEVVGHEDTEVALTVTHADLAEILHLNRVTVTLALQRLEEEGYVRRGHRELLITRNASFHG